jgi:hypothetical protein
VDGNQLFASIAGTGSDQSSIGYDVALYLVDPGDLIGKTVFIVEMIQSNKILIGRRVPGRSFCGDNIEALQLSIVLVSGIRYDLIEEDVNGCDNLVQLGYVDLIPPIIIGVSRVEAGVGLIIEVLPACCLGFKDVGLASPDAQPFQAWWGAV